ncbi:hypothetical protein BC628DRAFT_972162 [Trametes gibbosa]|nr:hypothetical protein BC628DRAFT_972162 [Trametes gibbosa]
MCGITSPEVTHASLGVRASRLQRHGYHYGTQHPAHERSRRSCDRVLHPKLSSPPRVRTLFLGTAGQRSPLNATALKKRKALSQRILIPIPKTYARVLFSGTTARGAEGRGRARSDIMSRALRTPKRTRARRGCRGCCCGLDACTWQSLYLKCVRSSCKCGRSAVVRKLCFEFAVGAEGENV